MWQRFLDLFFPRRSPSGSEGEWVTPEEIRALVPSPVVRTKEDLAAQGALGLDRVVAAFAYDDTPLLKPLIRMLKYGRVSGIAEYLARPMVEVSRLLNADGATPVIVPVPLHWARRFDRGFNQAEQLARFVTHANAWPLRHLLRRQRSTGYQAHRSRAERLVAMANAFVLRRAAIVPEYVVLVDDLCTTGSTLAACARTLREGGVRRVEALVLAQG